jgi:hypothetical protein
MDQTWNQAASDSARGASNENAHGTPYVLLLLTG